MDELAAGATLTLTIDSGLQAIVERELAEGVRAAKADAGTVIALDPKTGAVLALANYPTYDPNLPGEAGPGSRRNRAVTDSFEPGSTFKAILAAAALEERAVRPSDSVFCENGSYRIGGWTIHDHHPYGRLTIPEVIQFSSNIGVSKIAERLGRERYARYLESFGFGRRTAIDLPGEVSGIVRPVKSWAHIDLATGSFGQGLSVTPIQLATAYAAIANGGVLQQPHLLTRAVDRTGRVLLDRDDPADDAEAHRVVSAETAREVSAMLERVVELEGGTGGKARIPGVRIAGKTGTAQKVDSKTGRYSRERLASFVGYAPADDPGLVLLVMIDNPRGQTYGGLVAAPVFREIMSRALDRLGWRRPVAPPAPTVPVVARRGAKPAAPARAVAAATPADRTSELSNGVSVRSFVGMSLRRALELASADGLVVEARGSGFVTGQQPAPGTLRHDGDNEVVLYLEPSA
jgi:cell division protein FtsI (penicillin-binding protein 3)